MASGPQLLDLFPEITTGSWVAIGNFDGVHLGHQALIDHLISGARQENQMSVVVTFHPHPKVALESISAPFYLTTLQEKQALLQQLGLDLLVTLPFHPAVSNLSAQEFLQILVTRLSAKHLVVGPDFAIGKGRQGTLSSLQPFIQYLGLQVHVVEQSTLEGYLISSGVIRQLLKEGDVSRAARFLGRFYALEGQVIQGKGLGSKLGFPTANLNLLEPLKMLPQYGVYATWAFVRGARYAAITNVGVRPTFEIYGLPTIETLLLDFDDNIYGEDLKVEFVSHIRAEQKFSDLSVLIDQINCDKKAARRILTYAKKS